MSTFSPVKLSPAFKDYLWGGEKLRTEFNKHSDLVPLAESWELSAHRDGESRISGGEYDGLPLTAYIEAIGGKKALGKNAERFDYFPILIKFIDAKKDLSVQVHPDDAYALANEGEYGKTEMWYVLDCDEDAALYYGFSRDVTKEEYESAIRSGTLTDLLLRVPVKKGDVFFIPAGTVHAIGAGIVICEIQQNSNTTYRVYDYNRRDKDGNLRPLHVEKALAVTRPFTDGEIEKIRFSCGKPQGNGELLACSDFFKVRCVKIDGSIKETADKDSFVSIICLDGVGCIRHLGNEYPISKGDSYFIPADMGEYEIAGKLEVICSRI